MSEQMKINEILKKELCCVVNIFAEAKINEGFIL